ncbi:MAG: hypothetical protein ABXS91_05115 [Sulfurimonas sp.]
MQPPKGFGKRYFTLASILAYSVQKHLQNQTVQAVSLFATKVSKDEEEIDENDPPLDPVRCLRTLNAKPCHCNCYYRLRTRIILKINHFIPRCPYYTTWFAFRRTGVHPPRITL